MRPPKVHELQDLLFVKPERAVGDWVVMTKIEKFDADWEFQEPAYYIEIDGVNSPNKYRRFQEWLEDNPDTPIEMPEVCLWLNPLTGVWGPSFVNGRHRYAVLRDAGVEVMPFAVDADTARRFKKMYGGRA